MNILKSMVYGIAGNLFKRRKSASSRSRSYTCYCGKPVFFRNSACLSCGAQLGYDPELEKRKRGEEQASMAEQLLTAFDRGEGEGA